MLKDRQLTYPTLRGLIEAQIEELASLRVPGIVVVLTEERRLDVFTTLGDHSELDDETLRSMRWVLPRRLANGWTCEEVSPAKRDAFLGNSS